MSVDLIDFRTPVEAHEGVPDPERRVEGVPLQLTRNLFSDPSGHFHVGRWASEIGAWRIRYSEYELCHLLLGKVLIEDSTGRVWEYNAGDTFMIPKGFSGIWRVVERCEKVYAIYD